MRTFTQSFVSFAEQFDLNLEVISKYLDRGTKIGKILSKMKMHPLNIQAGVLAFRAAEFAAQIQFENDYALIERAFAGIRSCMTDHAADCAKFYSHQSLIDSGIRMALFFQNEEIIGRCVVNILTMQRMSHYTVIGHEEFDVGLTELGFHSYDDNLDLESSPFADINFLDVSDGFIPYNDGGGELFKSEDAAFYLDAGIEDSNPSFSDTELELILNHFELSGHPVSDAGELKMWTGKSWFHYGKFSNHSSHWVDWDLMIYRTPYGYHTDQGDEGVSLPKIFDDYGDLIPTDNADQESYLYPGQTGVWSVKGMYTLWYHQIPS